MIDHRGSFSRGEKENSRFSNYEYSREKEKEGEDGKNRGLLIARHFIIRFIAGGRTFFHTYVRVERVVSIKIS